MMRSICMAVSLALLPAVAAAQTPSDPVAKELAEVNATLKQIVALLDRQSDVQDLDLLMKRVQLSDSQVAELERRLRTAQSELRSAEEVQSNVEARLKVVTTSAEIPPAEREQMMVHGQAEQTRQRQRISQLTQEIAAIESELAKRRDDLRTWQAVLDKRLSKHAN